MTFSRRFAFSCLAILGLALALGSSAQAQTCGAYGSGGFPFPGWFGYAHSPYAMGQIPTPPYFAIHPPVYYSYPMPRTYGYSPYAYPGTTQTPELVAPEIIENPHVEKKLDSKLSKPVTAKVVRAEVIDNPFVRPELKAALHARVAAQSQMK